MDRQQFVEECEVVRQSREEIVRRTSSNNMLCVVEYIPNTPEEQEEIEQIFRVAA